MIIHVYVYIKKIIVKKLLARSYVEKILALYDSIFFYYNSKKPLAIFFEKLLLNWHTI